MTLFLPTTRRKAKPCFFYLRVPNQKELRLATQRLRDFGAKPLFTYGDCAVAARVRSEVFAEAQRSSLFAVAYNRHISKAVMSEMGPYQRAAAKVWNGLLPPAPARLRKKRPVTKSWGGKDTPTVHGLALLDQKSFKAWALHVAEDLPKEERSAIEKILRGSDEKNDKMKRARSDRLPPRRPPIWSGPSGGNTATRPWPTTRRVTPSSCPASGGRFW